MWVVTAVVPNVAFFLYKTLQQEKKSLLSSVLYLGTKTEDRKSSCTGVIYPHDLSTLLLFLVCTATIDARPESLKTIPFLAQICLYNTLFHCWQNYSVSLLLKTHICFASATTIWIHHNKSKSTMPKKGKQNNSGLYRKSRWGKCSVEENIWVRIIDLAVWLIGRFSSRRESD